MGAQKAKVGKRPKPNKKIRFRPKNREGKELRGENGAFDTETARFPTAHEVRSARKRPKSGKRPKIFGGSVVCRETKILNFEGSEIGVAELRSRRFSERLNRCGKTPNLGPPELAKSSIFTNHQFLRNFPSTLTSNYPINFPLPYS